MKKIISTICSLILCLGISFTFVGCIDDKDNNAEDYSQYYVDDCPIGLNGGGVGSSSLDLSFINNSDKKIISYEFVYILYDVYDNALIYIGDTDKYSKIQITPTNFAPNKTDYRRYSGGSQFYYAEVYVYYALFEDKTSWGYRENISNEKIVKFATKYKVERY